MRGLRHAVLVPALVLVACQAAPTPLPPNLGVANGTTITITIMVNGVRIGDLAAGVIEPVVDRSALPVLPWKVTIESPSGQLLGTMIAAAGAPTNGTTSALFDDLACGHVTVWIGPDEPAEPASPASDASPAPSLIPCGP